MSQSPRQPERRSRLHNFLFRASLLWRWGFHAGWNAGRKYEASRQKDFGLAVQEAAARYTSQHRAHEERMQKVRIDLHDQLILERQKTTALSRDLEQARRFR